MGTRDPGLVPTTGDGKLKPLLSIHRESAIRFSTIGILESHFTATTALPMATFPVES
jgi:hypothetical protein